jgi:LPXTG-motif cell wall-anchored protein
MSLKIFCVLYKNGVIILKNYKLNKKIVAIVFTFLFVLTTGITSLAASVTPTEHSGNESSGDVTPEGAVYFKYDGGTEGVHIYRFDADGTRNDSSGDYYIQFEIGKIEGNGYTEILSWSSNFYMHSVIVKGGSSYNLYSYPDPGSKGDTHLVSPVNGSGDPANVSHVSFVFWKAPPTGSLKVYKKDTESGDLLSGAVFELVGVGTGTQTSTGVHEWSGIPYGTYTLKETTVPDDHIKAADRQVTIDSSTPDVVITVNNDAVKKGSLIVYKTDQDDNPLGGAVFTLTPKAGGSAITGKEEPNGTHKWTDIPIGEYVLHETAPSGYTGVADRDVTILEDQTISFTLKNVRKLGNYTIYKKDQDDKVLAGAVFTLTPVTGGSAVTGTEDPAGTHSWSNLPTGEYYLHETPPSGYNADPSLPEKVTIYEGSDSRNVLTVKNSLKKGDFVVYKVDQDDKALAGAVFTLTPLSGGSAVTGTEDPVGTHTWEDLTPGSYTLKETSIPEGYSPDPTLPATVTVADGEKHEKKVINTRDTGTFKVYKQDDLEQPLAGAEFTLTPLAGGDAVPGVKNADGTEFTWSSLPTGKYTLKETTTPSGYYPDGRLPAEVTVYKGADSKNTFTAINSTDHCSLKIEKYDSYSQLITGLSVTFKLEKVGTDWESTKSSDTGSIFWGDLTPGEYKITEISAPEGYYYESHPDNVTLVDGDEKTVKVSNKEYVTIYALKRDINTKAVLEGAEFGIYNTDAQGDPTTKIGASQFTNAQGMAFFGKAYKLKAGVTYWIKELGSPEGYQNDAATAKGYAVKIEADGSSNEGDPVLFENTPLLQKITVLKYVKAGSDNPVFIGDLSDDTLLDGTQFQLWQGSKYLKSAYLSGGTCEFTDLVPGKYTVYEIAGDTTKYFEIDTSKDTEIVLMTQENIDAGKTDPEVKFVNTFETGDFAFIKHDSADFATVLQGAVYHLTGMYWNGSDFEEKTYSMTTNASGFAALYNLTPGTYKLKEYSAPAGYKVDPTEYIVEVFAGRTAEGDDVYHVSDDKIEYGSIVVAKFREGNTSVRLSGVVFSLYKDSVSAANLVATRATDVNGNAAWDNLAPGTYVLVEDSTIAGYQIITKTQNVTITDGERRVVIVYNRSITTPTPTPTTPDTPETTPTPTPSPTPTPTATPTPITTDELIIEEVDPAYGPETGEGDILFISIGAMLLLAAGLFILRKRLMLNK